MGFERLDLVQELRIVLLRSQSLLIHVFVEVSGVVSQLGKRVLILAFSSPDLVLQVPQLKVQLLARLKCNWVSIVQEFPSCLVNLHWWLQISRRHRGESRHSHLLLLELDRALFLFLHLGLVATTGCELCLLLHECLRVAHVVAGCGLFAVGRTRLIRHGHRVDVYVVPAAAISAVLVCCWSQLGGILSLNLLATCLVLGVVMTIVVVVETLGEV